MTTTGFRLIMSQRFYHTFGAIFPGVLTGVHSSPFSNVEKLASVGVKLAFHETPRSLHRIQARPDRHWPRLHRCGGPRHSKQQLQTSVSLLAPVLCRGDGCRPQALRDHSGPVRAPQNS